MIVRELDNTHDWTFGNGKSNYINESDAIKQCVTTKLLALKHDWFLNTDEGIPWFDYLEKNPNTLAMASDIKRAVLSVSGVTEITDFDIKLDNETRQFLVDVTYNDQFNSNNVVSVNVKNNQ